jgi:hypothetical protein
LNLVCAGPRPARAKPHIVMQQARDVKLSAASRAATAAHGLLESAPLPARANAQPRKQPPGDSGTRSGTKAEAS